MRVLVCGGRGYSNWGKVDQVLTDLWNEYEGNGKDIAVIIEGGALGADALGKAWALKNSTPSETWNPDWSKYGRAAGAIRNQTMLDQGKPNIVIAFPGGRGTADMVRRARSAGVEVREVVDD